MTAPGDELAHLIAKRLTLNLLIQGSAQHAMFTAHHIVRDELEDVSPGLTLLYDQFAIDGFLQFWIGEPVAFMGTPDHFWRRTTEPKHPFFGHPLLGTHGHALATAAKAYALDRAKAKDIARTRMGHVPKLVERYSGAVSREKRAKPRLVALAKRATSEIWGIAEDRLDAKLTTKVEFGRLRWSSTEAGRALRRCAVGYGGVRRTEGGLTVVAKATIWPVLAHELVKGTAELVCLHGLCALDRRTFDAVTEVADRIDHEPWLMHAGSELWRRLLALLPDGHTMPETLMHIARLEPRPLAHLMSAIVENQERGRALLAELGDR